MNPIAVTNRLLESLPHEERRELQDRCEPVKLVFGDILSEAGEPFSHAYFPLTGSISLVMPVEGHSPMGFGMIGNEGMLGATLALGIGDAPFRSLVQGSGTAFRMDATEFQCAVMKSPTLHDSLNRYLCVSSAQVAQSGPCSHFHDVRSRLARWLLMTHDRAHADQFHLTHQFLANMLGVQRSAITIAAGELQKQNTIRYVRGEIRVLSRTKLEAVSCECYDADVQSYAHVFN